MRRGSESTSVLQYFSYVVWEMGVVASAMAGWCGAHSGGRL